MRQTPPVSWPQAAAEWCHAQPEEGGLSRHVSYVLNQDKALQICALFDMLGEDQIVCEIQQDGKEK